jgi:hypothetical protein
MATKTDITLNTRVAQQTEATADRIRSTQLAFMRVESAEGENLEEIHESFKSYKADSWPEDKKRIRESEDKPTHDIARFPNIVDVPFEKDDFQTATFLNLHHQYNRHRKNSFLDQKDTQVFKDGLISGRSHREYALRPNKQDGSFDIVRIERPADEIFIERPFREIDASDSPGHFHVQWKTPDWLKNRYKGKEIDWSGLEIRTKDTIPDRVEETHVLDEYLYPSDERSEPFFDKEKLLVRMIRYWKKRYRTVFRVANLVNPRTVEDANLGIFRSRSEAFQFAIEFLGRIGGEINEQAVDDMITPEEEEYFSYHVISGRVELEWVKDWGDFVPIQHFFPYFANGTYHSLWNRLKDEIQGLNFLWSKLVERLGKIGWQPLLMEEDALAEGQNVTTGMKAWRDGKMVLLASGALNKGKVKIDQDHSLQAIGPYITMIQFMFQNLNEKSGANDPFRGVSPGANTAGIAIERLQQKGAAVVEPIFDNFRSFQRDDIYMEIEMLKRAYLKRPLFTILKMERIIGGATDEDSQDFLQSLQEGKITTAQGERDIDIEKILNLIGVVEYDISISQVAATASLRIASLQAIAQVVGATGIPVPPEVVIELSDFIPPEVKQKWLKGLQNMQVPTGETQPQNNNSFNLGV